MRWRDVDLDNNTIRVCRQLSKIGNKHALDSLKPESSKRLIAIPPEVSEALKAHKEAEKVKLKEVCGMNDLDIQKYFTDQDSLVSTSKVGTAIQPDNFIRNFKNLLKTAKLPDIRFHGLRHTFATISLQQGVDPKSLQSDLGHESIETTLDKYGHVNTEIKRSAAKKRTGIFNV